jgi:hypothetical protein
MWTMELNNPQSSDIYAIFVYNCRTINDNNNAIYKCHPSSNCQRKRKCDKLLIPWQEISYLEVQFNWLNNSSPIIIKKIYQRRRQFIKDVRPCSQQIQLSLIKIDLKGYFCTINLLCYTTC